MFGVDFFQLTFVNRQFSIFFPFHTDARSEGDFLELQALAEIPDQAAPGGFRILARSMTRTLTNREQAPRTVTTSNTRTRVTYAGKLVGFNIAVQEDYLLPVGVRNPASSTPDDIVLDPALVPADASVRFARYQAGTMRIILLTELLDQLAPDQKFSKNVFPFQDPIVIANIGKQELRSTIPPRIVQIFEDAGFQGVAALWQDEQAAAQLMRDFTQRFTNRGGAWQLTNTNAPLVTSFWNFYITHNSTLGEAAVSELLGSAQIRTTINSREVFLVNNTPVGGSTKIIQQPVGIGSEVFRKLVTDDPGTGGFRKFQNTDELRIALRVLARKIAATAAHEVAHSLGMMHTAGIGTGTTATETSGAPVLSVTSSDLRGHIGPDVRFSMQAKVIWNRAFGVTPTFNDTTFQNKTWQVNEIPTLPWGDRKQRFRDRNGESKFVSPPGILTTANPPPFGVSPPGAQRGTK
jgi:hypothetical protein